jgi:phosphoadenosine phosphosulfate reductase
MAESLKQQATPQDTLKDAFERFETNRISISFSGAEDVVLIDMAHKLLGSQTPVFCLDTGRLHSETYQFLDKVREYYNINIDIMFPKGTSVENLVTTKGLFSFFEEGHQECCSIRKIEPLRRKLEKVDAWITGQRKDQSVTRLALPHEQIDTAFSTPDHELIKFNPLANWTSVDVWDYIRETRIPYNPLHDQGFLSIGCQPCTRAIGPGQHERSGRWWWEDSEDKECGLHSQNVEIQPVRVVR